MRVYSIYFSPTGTTKKVVEAISEEFLDLLQSYSVSPHREEIAADSRGCHCEGGAADSRSRLCEGGAADSRNCHCEGGAADSRSRHCEGGAADRGNLPDEIASLPLAMTEREIAAMTPAMTEGISLTRAMEHGEKLIVYDFTLPKERAAFPQIESDSILFFGVPTYAGRVPNLLLKYLDTIEGNGALAVPIVTFGNRAFDNSLIELRDILEAHNFRTIAAAAFSCQHSFSDTLAAGRPDMDDLNFAKDFAGKVFMKLYGEIASLPLAMTESEIASLPLAMTESEIASLPLALTESEIASLPLAMTPGESDAQRSRHCEGGAADRGNLASAIEVPGDVTQGYYQPKREDGTKIDMRKVKPKTGSGCIGCGRCADVCPMGAISPTDPTIVEGICIKCCACVKQCPTNAKYFDDPDFLYHKSELESKYITRAENKAFI